MHQDLKKKHMTVFEKLANFIEAHAFEALAFSMLGLMFAMRPVTWAPTLILLCSVLAVLLNGRYRCTVMARACEPELRWIVASFVVWFVVCLFVGVWHWGWAKQAFPAGAFRVLLALGAFTLLISAASKNYFVAGMLAASIFAVANVVHGQWAMDQYFPRIRGTTNHPIHFGNFTALVAVLLLSVAFLGRFYKQRWRLLYVFGALLALVASAASLSRSSFVALLCVVPLLLVTQTDVLHRWLNRLVYVAVVACTALVMMFTPAQEALRLKAAVSDVEMMEANNYQGSMGARIAMWRGALAMFGEHPWVGIGPHRFHQDFSARVARGEVPQADANHNQPHNDMLNAAATGGVLMLVAYLFLIASPFAFFYKIYQRHRLDLDRRVLPLMGMQLVGVFFLTGLTNSNFDLEIYSTSYGVLVAVLARLCLAERKYNNPTILGDNLPHEAS
jgi:O-antigen ligase